MNWRGRKKFHIGVMALAAGVGGELLDAHLHAAHEGGKRGKTRNVQAQIPRVL